jgi:hypothetical protein
VLPLLVQGVVEKGPELRSGQGGRRVRHRLDQTFQVELGGKEVPDVVDDLQGRVGFCDGCFALVPGLLRPLFQV